MCWPYVYINLIVRKFMMMAIQRRDKKRAGFKSVLKEAIRFASLLKYSYTVFNFIFYNGNFLLKVARNVIETREGCMW
jgi:hypothetical protein